MGNTNDSVQVSAPVVNQESATTNGREHLIKLENINAVEVEDKIKQSIADTETKKVLAENGQVDFKRYYKNTVFMGDSISEFLSAADILSKNNVCAVKGRNVISAMQDLDKVKMVNPDNIIMLYAMNDIECFDNPQDYKKNYKELVKQIKTSLPKAKIFIESPLRVQAKATRSAKKLTNENVIKFRQMAKEVAEEENVNYVDITSLVEEKYFEQDGIHFKYDFYPRLLSYLKNVIETSEEN